ncbi:MAG: RagB/SusD family nutrient uptake outer membrane protein [Gemmatimonadales bacterium]
MTGSTSFFYRTASGLALVVAATGPLTGCGSLLDVELPTRVRAEALDNPQLAATLIAGAIGDFECSLTNYITATGLLGDELIESTGFAAYFIWDQRRIFSNTGSLGTGNCNDAYGVFTPLHTARYQAEDAFRRITGFPDADVPNKPVLLATAAAYAGYAYTLLGEGFCEMTVDAGPLMPPADVLRKAEAQFTTAIDLATTANNADILNMARVGRARVRLDLGKKAEAATDARAVPAGYVKNASRSTANERRWNRTYADGQRNFFVSVDPRYRNLTVDGVPDARVSTVDAGRNGNDGITRAWFQRKYLSEAAPVPIATWREAQLIIAEAEGGQAAVDAINRLRTLATLPLFSSTDPAAIQTQVREERRRELFLEGQRFNDMLRFNLPFDTGVNSKGVTYGDTKCLPLPDAERLNNPNTNK